MSDQQAAGATSADSSMQVALLEVNFGIVVSASIFCAVELGVAEQLRQGPLHINDLAQATGARADGLLRVLRILVAYGIFQEVAPEVFKQSPLSSYLLPECPGSVRQRVLMRNNADWWRIWENLTACVRSGVPAFKLTWGEGFWSHLQKHAELEKLFDDAMTGASNAVNDSLVEAYDFSQARLVIDIAGGEGSLLAAILERYPHVRGVLFERAPVIEKARVHYQQTGLLKRCEFKTGDFFSAVPGGGDIYILKAILHNWDDEHCLTILRNCRRAMKAGSRLITIDMLNEPSDPSPYGHLMDLYMYALFNGHERSSEGFRTLYEAAGLRLTRIVPNATIYPLIEGEAV